MILNFNNWEGITLFAILVYQCVHSFVLWVQINNFQYLFSGTTRVILDEADREPPYIDNQTKNKSLEIICNSLNTYLEKNFGAGVNFSIIQDIVERRVEAEDEKYSSAISTPLYLGLAATMFGIIVGLSSVPTQLAEMTFAESFSPLIKGVQGAMVVSLTGLACTTFLSNFIYKSARTKIMNEKGEFLSLLQRELLPEMNKADKTGVAGLKTSLDNFSKRTFDIISKMEGMIYDSRQNIEIQNTIIEKIEKIDFEKITHLNIQLSHTFEKSVEKIAMFNSYLDRMDRIAGNLLLFANRTSDIELIVGEIKSNISDSKLLIRFLTEHLDKIENMGEATLKAVDLADANFKSSIEKLQAETETRTDVLNQLANTAESDLKVIFHEIGEKIKAIALQYIIDIEEILKNNSPTIDLPQPDLSTVEELFQENNKILQEISSKPLTPVSEKVIVVEKETTEYTKTPSELLPEKEKKEPEENPEDILEEDIEIEEQQVDLVTAAMERSFSDTNTFNKNIIPFYGLIKMLWRK